MDNRGAAVRRTPPSLPTAVAGGSKKFGYHALLPTADFLPETMYLHAHLHRDLPETANHHDSHTDGLASLIAGRISSLTTHIYDT
jgi:hypothetical protein